MDPITLGIIGAGVVKSFSNTNKANKLNEKALEKYGRAFEIENESQLLVQKKAELTDKRLCNVAKKKRAIISNTLPQFVDVYSQIQKVEISSKNEQTDFAISKYGSGISVLQSMSISFAKSITDTDLVCGCIMGLLGTTSKMESERFHSAASSQLRSANVVHSQAQSIVAVYDAIIGRADRIAKLLMAMNTLWMKSINQTKETIERKGLNIRNYSEFDKGVLMTCVNIADAVSKIIDVPVVDENGELCQSAEEMIMTGEKYISEMNTLIM